MYYNFYQVFMSLSLVVSLYLITLIWRRRAFPGAGAMIALLAAIFVWTLGFFLESHGTTLDRQLFYTDIGYLGSMSVPIAWFVFALNYSNGRKLIAGRNTIYFCIFPFIITILIWTNGLHHLMWSNEKLAQSGAFLITTKSYGPIFWVALAHNYLYILAGGIVLLRRLFTGTRLYTSQAVSMIIAVLLPWVWNAIYVFDLADVPRKDLTPAMFAVSGLVLAFGLLRLHLFETIPFTHKFVIKQISDGVLAFNARDVLVEVNPMLLKTLGLDERILGKKLEDLAPLSPAFNYLSPEKFGRQEIILNVAGEKHYFDVESAPMADDAGKKVGWLAIFHDVTGNKRAEEQYRLVTEHSADVIYRLTLADERYTYISPSAQRMFGYTDKEALAIKPKDVLTPESYQQQLELLMEDIKLGTPYRIMQLEAVHKDGHVFPVEVHGTMVRNEKGEPVEIVGVVRDISERKKMEEQLIMQDRLASIGQLTSGMAHEMNNPLTSVISFSSLLLNRDLPEDVKQDIKIINDEAQRTAAIVKNLLSFTRKQSQDKQPVNINDCISKVLEVRAYEQKVNNIESTFRPAPDLPLVTGDASQLQQVFFDIVINAEYFMLEAHAKGVLDITTEKAGDSVRIKFTDDGPGISRDNLKHIFTPFFTTKEVGKGTGLSLSICLGIITEHRGKIWAESEPGKSTTFYIELPVQDRATEA